MSSSSLFMAFPPPMPVVYPHSTISGSSSLSRGSFGPVFVVLAVITVLAAIACFVGRVLARHYFQPPGRRERALEFGGGIEDGFEMDISHPVRITRDGEVKAEKKPTQVGGSTKGEARPTAAMGGMKPNA